jgi:hypothetical protein
MRENLGSIKQSGDDAVTIRKRCEKEVASLLLTVSRHADIMKVSQEPFRTGGEENGLADFAQ